MKVTLLSFSLNHSKILMNVEILSEKLPIFINELRNTGYNISTAQFIAVQKLILTLAKQGKLPSELVFLKTLIAPILCHTHKEQQAFSLHFDNWVQSIKVSEEIRHSEQNAISDTQHPQKVRSPQKWAIITIITIAILIGSWVVHRFSPEIPFTKTPDITKPSPSLPEPILPEPILPKSETPPPSSEPQASPDLPAETSESPEPQTYFWWLLLVLPLIFSILVYFWRRYLARLYLARKYTSIQPDIQKLPVKTIEKNIFQPFQLSHSAQQLRKHIAVESNQVDVTASVEKTIAAGGWFTPVPGTIKRRPEYLVLIDRLTFKDHQTKLVDTLIQQLLDEEVLMNRYYFDATPRRCYPENQHLAPLTLTELAEHYPTHKLLIFSDGNGFINSITGKIVPWIQQLSIWTYRALFTLETPQQWGYREQVLKEEADFLIMPANEAGLKFLVEQINANTQQSYQSPLWQRARKNLAFPEYLQENFNRWLERHTPEPEVLNELLTQIKSFLGTEGYYWFCACAVYPELHWQVTLYLGNNLNSEPGKTLLTKGHLDEDPSSNNLAKLARLPWFRYGYMPDWLREPLIKDLSSQQKDTEVHTTLEKLLQTITLDNTSETADKTSATTLNIAHEQPKRRTKRSPLKEHVFVKFMADKLAVKLPESARRFMLKSVKLPIISANTVWKITTIILLVTILGVAVLEGKYYLEEQQDIAEFQAEQNSSNNFSEKRVALVIGNAKYPFASLKNPVNDAKDINNTLRKLGFTVIYGKNTTLQIMKEALYRFQKKLGKNTVGLFYFSGYGIQYEQKTYLISTDLLQPSISSIKQKSVTLKNILTVMAEANNDMNIIILDASRNNPFRNEKSIVRGGLRYFYDIPEGFIIAFATPYDGIAKEGLGRNSLYTKHLLRFISKPDLRIDEVFLHVRKAVSDETDGKQRPGFSVSLRKPFCLNGCRTTMEVNDTKPIWK